MLVKLLGEILTTQLHARYKWDRGAAKSSLVFWRALKRPSTHLLSINARCNSGGNFATLAEPSGTTIAFGINDAGQIVGEFEDANGHGHGFLYSGGAFTNFDFPSATDTFAFGINNAGQIVGQYVDASGHGHGFLYSGGTFTTLDDPLGTVSTSAQGINDAGQIV